MEGQPHLLCEGACELLLRRGTRHLGLAPPALGPPVASDALSVDHSGTLDGSYRREPSGVFVLGYAVTGVFGLMTVIFAGVGVLVLPLAIAAGVTGCIAAVIGGFTIAGDVAGDAATIRFE